MIKPLARYFMKRAIKDSDRSPSLVQGAHIRDVAIVAVYQPGESFSHINTYVKEWRKRGMRSVDLFLYFTNKKSLDAYQGFPKDIPFMRKDFNFAGKAVSDELVSGLKKEYDVLIDLSRGAAFPCDVVISKINAKWKAGEQHDDRSYLLDLMIDLKGDPDVRKLIHHMDHYLVNLNTSNAA